MIDVMKSAVVNANEKCFLYVELAAIGKDACNIFVIVVSFYKVAPKK